MKNKKSVLTRDLCKTREKWEWKLNDRYPLKVVWVETF